LRHIGHYLALAREKGLAIRYVLDTHAHADHISGAADLAAKVGAPYYLHPYDAIHPIDVLPDETVVLPGHFNSPAEAKTGGLYVASLGELKRQNEGLKMAQNGEASFVKYILDSLPKFPPQYVDIKRVNAGLLAADEEKASELELGKNICALTTKKWQ
jgi:glyoxylase-like metal-dependent hydrolase (beta-lactamase superfamily II)